MKREYLNKRDKDQMIASNGKIRKPIEIYQYTAGDNVAISEDHVISAVDTKYTAGQNISISEDNVISATGGGGGTTYTAGDNIQISAQNVISATDTKYTAGSNVQISEQNVISATDTRYTAGQNISIDANNVISATGGGATYTAGAGISIDQNNVITNTGIGSMSQEEIPWTTEALDIGFNYGVTQTYTANQQWYAEVPALVNGVKTKKIAVQLQIVGGAGDASGRTVADKTGFFTEYQCPEPSEYTGYNPMSSDQLQIGHLIPFKLKFYSVYNDNGEPTPWTPSVPDIEGYLNITPTGNNALVSSYRVGLWLLADSNNPIEITAIKARIFAYK